MLLFVTPTENLTHDTENLTHTLTVARTLPVFGGIATRTGPGDTGDALRLEKA